MLRQEPQVAALPPLHPHVRDAKHLGGLRLRHPLEAHQAEELPLVGRQLADRLEHAVAVRAGPESMLAGAGTRPSHSSTVAG